MDVACKAAMVTWLLSLKGVQACRDVMAVWLLFLKAAQACKDAMAAWLEFTPENAAFKMPVAVCEINKRGNRYHVSNRQTIPLLPTFPSLDRCTIILSVEP